MNKQQKQTHSIENKLMIVKGEGVGGWGLKNPNLSLC